MGFTREQAIELLATESAKEAAARIRFQMEREHAAFKVVQRRVAKGAALLDSQRPDWFQRIETSMLSMESATHCILGQTFKDFANGATGYAMGLGILVDEVNEDDEAVFAIEHGFLSHLERCTDTYDDADLRDEYDVISAAWDGRSGIEYGNLALAWKSELQLRRDAAERFGWETTSEVQRDAMGLGGEG